MIQIPVCLQKLNDQKVRLPKQHALFPGLGYVLPVSYLNTIWELKRRWRSSLGQDYMFNEEHFVLGAVRLIPLLKQVFRREIVGMGYADYISEIRVLCTKRV